MWGFSSSPCIYRDTVIVYAGSEQAKEGHVFAFNIKNGDVTWSAPAGKMSYASVQTIDVL
jgi:outer membrane protein assembly factor BamB